ncbi:MAG: BREX-3 system P-loop-containing protein BrxF [Syntrophomonadaceae bacterium]|nr:BREX-3 system P-loop-containing protein BrxF [Syntrophomonadaceae bacterium]
MKLDTLLEQNSSNYYKMLVIVDNSNQHEKIIEALEPSGWQAVDVTEHLLDLLERVPERDRRLRIGRIIKEWFRELPDNVILYDASILYSPELGRMNPVGAFKYKSREKEIVVIMNGKIYGERIRYSEYGREDFCEMDVSELIHARIEDIVL